MLQEKKLIIVLTQYKRNNLKSQLDAIKKQTLNPDYLVVFQNENHVDIEYLKNDYNFIHVKSDYNTKFFARFAYCFTFPVDIFIIMDDDIIPANNCIKHYVDECIKENAIMGGNARYGFLNKKIKNILKDTGIRNKIKADFVGHLWCFKKEWLHYMFSIKPCTYDTGEDMHLCFSSKILGNINAYQCSHPSKNENCDITNNGLAGDKFSSYKKISPELRKSVEQYFVDNYNLKMVE